jgi:hypothetical protein
MQSGVAEEYLPRSLISDIEGQISTLELDVVELGDVEGALQRILELEEVQDLLDDLSPDSDVELADALEAFVCPSEMGGKMIPHMPMYDYRQRRDSSRTVGGGGGDGDDDSSSDGEGGHISSGAGRDTSISAKRLRRQARQLLRRQRRADTTGEEAETASNSQSFTSDTVATLLSNFANGTKIFYSPSGSPEVEQLVQLVCHRFAPPNLSLAVCPQSTSCCLSVRDIVHRPKPNTMVKQAAALH